MKKAILSLFAVCLVASPVWGQKTNPEIFPLWKDGAPGALGKKPEDQPRITLYRPSAKKHNGAAVVVCPGGGYRHLAMDHEGKQIAEWLNKLGVTAVVLQYRLGPRYHHPIELGDAQRAIRMTRANASDWRIDAKRIGIMGFSAGGHLASTAGTHFDLGNEKASDDIDRQSCRPDFMILMYPVITLKGPFAHNGSRINLLGKDADKKLIDSLCNETQVTKNTPPTFLVHTSEDRAVPSQNSVFFYLALRKAGVPAEMHIYEKGRHGLGLGPKELPYSSWPARCEAWLRGRGILSPAQK